MHVKGTPCNGVEHVIAKRARPHNEGQRDDDDGDVAAYSCIQSNTLKTKWWGKLYYRYIRLCRFYLDYNGLDSQMWRLYAIVLLVF